MFWVSEGHSDRAIVIDTMLIPDQDVIYSSV